MPELIGVDDGEDVTLERVSNLDFRIACPECARLRTNETCEAFPAGIPAVLLTGQIKHDQPFPGDNGLTFTPHYDRFRPTAAADTSSGPPADVISDIVHSRIADLDDSDFLTSPDIMAAMARLRETMPELFHGTGAEQPTSEQSSLE